MAPTRTGPWRVVGGVRGRVGGEWVRLGEVREAAGEVSPLCSFRTGRWIVDGSVAGSGQAPSLHC